MITLKQAIVVEGKYDKIKLANFINATIITTNGFRIFKDKQKRDFIRLIAQKNGIIVMTDSDSAGSLIRSHLKQICPDGTIINVYVPQLSGKEKRKNKPSKEGLLGVEGLSEVVIIDALKRSGVTEANVKRDKLIKKSDLFALGLSGGKNSSTLREELADFLKLPLG
ncbi:MAG: DUF4093 domain-containing protein, partial [Clostridia bacterium]|nr:DUF4093 domain-containing protein [Clostridia bacterium]